MTTPTYFSDMTTIARIIGAVAAALAAAAATILLFALICMPFERFISHPTIFYVSGVFEGFARGFAFVFVGSMVARRRWRNIAALCLVLLGIAAYIYDHARYSSDPGLPVWHFSSCIAGGSLAAIIQACRTHRQGAPPNGGPARHHGSSGVTDGPPSGS